MNAYRSKPLNFPWPPFLYGFAIIAALVLDRLLVLPVPDIHGIAAWIAGALLTTLAVTLDVWAVKTLVDSHTAVMPYRCSTYLVTRGPFRYTRNPTYLSYTLITAAFGLLTGNPWFFVTAAIAAVVTRFVAIGPEEMHLLSRFGCEFEYYCKRTRRWI